MENEVIRTILFLGLFILFTYIMCDTEDKTYTKDNKERASKIRDELPKMVYPIKIYEYFSSTRGGRTEIKFKVINPNPNQEINFSFCKNGEWLMTQRIANDIIMVWEYPQKQCQ